MTPADLAAARKEAEDWLAEHGGAVWCADVELILRSLLAASPEPAPVLPAEVREVAERLRAARRVNSSAAVLLEWELANAVLAALGGRS